MTAELADVIERVSDELGQLIDALDREGPRYAHAYARHVLTSRPGGRSPAAPADMPPIAATCIKELVLDELALVRRQGGARRRLGGAR